MPGVDADTLADRLRRCPVIRFEQSDQTRPLRNRIHVDGGYPGPIGDSVEALKAEGGREAFTCEWYATLADAGGNEVDLVPGGGLGEGSTADWSVLFGAMACYPGVSPTQAADLAGAAAGLADGAAAPGAQTEVASVVFRRTSASWLPGPVANDADITLMDAPTVHVIAGRAATDVATVTVQGSDGTETVPAVNGTYLLRSGTPLGSPVTIAARDRNGAQVGTISSGTQTCYRLPAGQQAGEQPIPARTRCPDAVPWP